ncbi:hypothetical protein A2609_02425 [Candidatus Kaiserbacteria bacterium RIFOXYD1_FULL_47_14]|uniref:Uncharacterized protein n=1 Tax=Candidatus Kaiserbacteria bacterium RIFOXYD1_FULL_47_14 TaxID=1798533 RepID=A0A1F6G789_9BACT|nr:MAG: hypothetical protein A2609_02425 [Candidatus Kaiserbacteria bacterium RIFOXYD1_FULL_47_14]
MRTIFEHIENAKQKPHHIRKRIAFASAAGVSALIAFVWFAGSLATGSFAVRGTSFADAGVQGGIETTSGGSGYDSASSGIAGAAAALQNKNASAHIEIVDTASSTRPVRKAEQTTIPF